jgi:hypothetical protein
MNTQLKSASRMCAALGIASILLCLFCAVQVPVRKYQTPEAVKAVSKIVDTSKLNPEQKERLDFYVGQILWNDHISLATHRNIWPASTIGFLLIGVLNLLIARWLSKQSSRTNS